IQIDLNRLYPTPRGVHGVSDESTSAARVRRGGRIGDPAMISGKFPEVLVATAVEMKPSTSVAGGGWRELVSLIVAALAAVIFWIVSALPYLMFDRAHLDQYPARRAPILLHIAFGTIALLTGPLQLWLGLSDRRVDVHRRLGQIYLIAVAGSALAAFYLATH